MSSVNFHVLSVRPKVKVAIGASNGVANTINTATAAATAGVFWNVCSVDVSTPGVISAADVTLVLTRTYGGVSEVMTYGIPAAQVMPFGISFGDSGLHADANTVVTATCSALGVGISSYVNIVGRRVQVG